MSCTNALNRLQLQWKKQYLVATHTRDTTLFLARVANAAGQTAAQIQHNSKNNSCQMVHVKIAAVAMNGQQMERVVLQNQCDHQLAELTRDMVICVDRVELKDVDQIHALPHRNCCVMVPVKIALAPIDLHKTERAVNKFLSIAGPIDMQRLSMVFLAALKIYATLMKN